MVFIFFLKCAGLLLSVPSKDLLFYNNLIQTSALTSLATKSCFRRAGLTKQGSLRDGGSWRMEVELCTTTDVRSSQLREFSALPGEFREALELECSPEAPSGVEADFCFVQMKVFLAVVLHH